MNVFGVTRRSALLFALLLAAAGPAARPTAAATTIDVRVSVKVIVSIADGTRPSIQDLGLPYLPIQDQDIYDLFQFANDSLLTDYWRGYRFVVTEIVNVGSPCPVCTPTNPSFWYSTAFDSAKMYNLEVAAKSNTSAYQWRNDAVNLYVNWGHGNGAISSFPYPAGGSNDVVVAGSRVCDPQFRQGFGGVILHHELGHYFNLAHPNKFLSDCCNPDSCIIDADSLEETLPDAPCFSLDQLSIYRWGQPFSAVSPVKQDSLWNTFWNNMSYLHPGQTYGLTFNKILVESQLDRWTDTANGIRAAVRSGRTRFVSPVPCSGCPPASGTSTDPYHSISSAFLAASAGDILLLRPGDYSASPLLNQPITLRATHAGYVRITNSGGGP